MSILQKGIQLIDCGADPSSLRLSGPCIVAHQKRSFFFWDPKDIKLFRLEHLQKGRAVSNLNLRKELLNKSLNVNLLDELIKNPYLIPKEWKRDENRDNRHIFFWGTIYSFGNRPYVLYLYWGDREWEVGPAYLDEDWSQTNPFVPIVTR